MIKDAISLLLGGASLSREQARASMSDIIAGEAGAVSIAAFLTALRMKGETPEELAGCADAMRSSATQVRPQRRDLIDTCGTGGDGGATFNISTAAAFVVAGMGLGVAKHGNRSVSSRCGSADVLEALGVGIELEPELVAQCIDVAGIGFMFAPRLHPGARQAAPVRRELGVRTVFNMLGPLTNPAGVKRQIIGAFSLASAETMAGALALLDCERAWVVHGHDGMDEISPFGLTTVFEVRESGMVRFEIDPREVGLGEATRTGLAGGDAAHNGAVINAVLSDERCSATEVVVLNAGACAVVADIATDLRTGIELARESIRSGKALAALEQLREMSNQIKPDVMDAAAMERDH